MNNMLAALKHEIRKARASDPDWLTSSVGGRILKVARSMDLPWPQLIRLFGVRQRRLEKLFSFHRIRKERPRFLSWSLETEKIVRDFYKKSRSVTKPRESSVVSRAMEDAVNASRKRSGLPPVSLNGIRCFAKTLKLRWGWTTWNTPQPFSEKEKAIMTANFYRVPWPALREMLPGRSKEEIRMLGRQLGMKRHRAMYTEKELKLLREAVNASARVKNDTEFEKLTQALCQEIGRTRRGVEHKMLELDLHWRYEQSVPEVLSEPVAPAMYRP